MISSHGLKMNRCIIHTFCVSGGRTGFIWIQHRWTFIKINAQYAGKKREFVVGTKLLLLVRARRTSDGASQQSLWDLGSNLFTLPPVKQNQLRRGCCFMERLRSGAAVSL